MSNIYSIDGIIPVVDPATFVHPTAVLIGDVIIGANCYIGPGASLRGDMGRIVIEAGSNLQDNCVVHTYPNMETTVETGGHIGHGAILHGCRIGRNAMIGMNAVVMDGAEIGESSVVAALSFVKAGMFVPPHMLVAGIPGRLVRELTEEEVAVKTKGTGVYQTLAKRSLASMHTCEPLTQPEPNRRRIELPRYDPPAKELHDIFASGAFRQP
ncbi:MAG TPA: DapH/DapD/GlmU-related protein [Chthoniobacterales bacterium]